MSRFDAAHMVCLGCGHALSPDDPRPFRCPRKGELPQVDHVLVRRMSLNVSAFARAFADDEPNPFIRYRAGLLFHATGRAHGLGDAELVAATRELDRAVAEVAATGFRVTPLLEASELAAAAGLGRDAQLWAKDESSNVSGSHKARHLMGIQLWLDVARRAGFAADASSPLAIASCGNAALAAAVVARAAREDLNVYVPVDAEPSVVDELGTLGAEISVCPREDGVLGDPCMRDFHAAVAAGMIPYGCQGSENGLTLEGGRTLGYELVDQIRRRRTSLDDVVIQVGGGALASSLVLALRDLLEVGLLRSMPRLCFVQTAGAYPLYRAWSRIVDRLLETESTPVPNLIVDLQRARAAMAVSAARRDEAVRYAAEHRPSFMWPWESTPRSYATGILDDETYDWRVLVEAMLETGGLPVIASETALREAHRLVPRATGLPICATGCSGVAGVMELQRAGAFAPDARIGVVLSGHQR